MSGRPRNNDVPEDLADDIIEAYVKDEVTLLKLARHFKVTQYVMTMFLTDRGVKIRPAGRIPKIKSGDI